MTQADNREPERTVRSQAHDNADAGSGERGPASSGRGVGGEPPEWTTRDTVGAGLLAVGACVVLTLSGFWAWLGGLFLMMLGVVLLDWNGNMFNTLDLENKKGKATEPKPNAECKLPKFWIEYSTAERTALVGFFSMFLVAMVDIVWGIADPEVDKDRIASEAQEKRKGFHCLSVWDGSHRALTHGV